MIDRASITAKNIAVFGLGKSGISSASALAGYGANVLAWDDNENSRDHAKGVGISLSDLYAADWGQIDALILSPGIPLYHPEPHGVAKLAQQSGCETIGDIEILGRVEQDSRFIGITGTNGKSTTTALIGHVLDASGYSIEVGGNLGKPSLDMKSLGKDGVYVLEMSSYQIDLTPSLAFDAAILLNITPDHLERHGGMDGYVKAKKAIFANQGPTHTAVIGVDTEPSHEIYAALQKSRNQTVVPISGNTPVSGGVFVENGILIDDSYYRREPIMDLRDVVTLTGEHNWQNAAASFATFRAIGLEVDEIVSGMGTYPGLSHRQEIVKTIDGVLFVNDSKATNPDAAARALASYTNIYWIAGGQSKEGGFDQLLPYLKNVHHAYLVGDDAELIHQAIYSDASCTISGNIADATAAAYRQAVKDGNESAVVMFSPACASFDQFKNFEERGDHFKQCVASIHTKSRGVA